uniref:phospholipase D n=1 Tax=Macrostomum lignano TaxID=282301 RepID=A0A1I8FER1_9PLAT
PMRPARGAEIGEQLRRRRRRSPARAEPAVGGGYLKSGGGGGGADEADTGGIRRRLQRSGRARHAAPGEGQALAGAAHALPSFESCVASASGLAACCPWRRGSILQAYHYLARYATPSRMQSQRDSTQVQNNLSWSSLFRKIVEMHRLGRPFRVYLVIPVLPMFTCEGMESGVLSPPVLMMLHPRVRFSLLSLRNWARQPSGQLVTEQVYVHSKVIIADDSMCIIGSANINDRSLRGDCDSEVAGLFEDTGEDLRPEVWQSGRVRVGRFAGSLRRYLMREHLGITAAATAAAEAAAALSEASETAGTSAANADATRRDSETSGSAAGRWGAADRPTDDAVFPPDLDYHRKTESKDLREAARERIEKVRGHLIEHPAVSPRRDELGLEQARECKRRRDAGGRPGKEDGAQSLERYLDVVSY